MISASWRCLAPLAVRMTCASTAPVFGYLAWAGVLAPSLKQPLPLIVDGEPLRDGDSQPMDIETLVDDLEQPPKKNEAEDRAQKEREQKDPRGQVVDIAQPAIEQRPDQAKFLSEYDSSVLRESKGQVGQDKAVCVPSSATTDSPSPRRSSR